ncbi:Uma2 family endonuclease [Edaphobacter modestus]|nr:Uma2 family endonuclease [Edaphobacter modestus]
MSTGLEIPKMPSTLVIKPVLSDDDFEQLCATNADVALERTKEGEIVVNAPAGFRTDDANSEIIAQLRVWWKTHRRGRVCGSSAGFFLPDRSSKSPDAAYITDEQSGGLTNEELDHFLHLAPAFVVELRSKSDALSKALSKMELWLANGVQLGWLVDPYTRAVYIYEAGKDPRKETGEQIAGSGPVEGFVLDLNEVWSSYRV